MEKDLTTIKYNGLLWILWDGNILSDVFMMHELENGMMAMMMMMMKIDGNNGNNRNNEWMNTIWFFEWDGVMMEWWDEKWLGG